MHVVEVLYTFCFVLIFVDVSVLVLWKFAIYRKASNSHKVFAVLVLVFVVYNRRREAQIKYPGPDDDVRENIINYEDEGGGEDDMTAFDITPLQVKTILFQNIDHFVSDPHRRPILSTSQFTTAKNTL